MFSCPFPFWESTKKYLKKWQNSVAQNPALKSPQSIIRSPQTHHEFTIKKTLLFPKHPLKTPAKPQKLSPGPPHIFNPENYLQISN
jgi:hypothetical protein